MASTPKPRIGDIVYWQADQGESVHAAVITDIGPNNVSLNIFHPNMYNMQPLEGVPHRDSDFVEAAIRNGTGYWAERDGSSEEERPAKRGPGRPRKTETTDFQKPVLASGDT